SQNVLHHHPASPTRQSLHRAVHSSRASQSLHLLHGCRRQEALVRVLNTIVSPNPHAVHQKLAVWPPGCLVVVFGLRALIDASTAAPSQPLHHSSPPQTITNLSSTTILQNLAQSNGPVSTNSSFPASTRSPSHHQHPLPHHYLIIIRSITHLRRHSSSLFCRPIGSQTICSFYKRQRANHSPAGRLGQRRIGVSLLNIL